MNSAADRRSRRGLGVAAVAVVGVLVAGTGAWATPANGLASWNFHQIHLTSVGQHAGHDGRGVVVAVVDTWVDKSNTNEFGNRVLPGADCLDQQNGNCTPGPAKPDDCGHGTHVSGTIASKTWGVAPEATIMPVRVLTDPDGHHPD